MKIVVGLGNPGPSYETTRHNAGFLAVDRLIERWKAEGPAEKHEAEIYSATVGGEKVMIIKPQTYMNKSGKSVAPLFQFYKCAPEDLLVIHDELDLMPLDIRIKTGGGTAGHNGLKSLDAHLGAGKLGYHRIRIGIGHPSKLNSPLSPADHALQQFTDEELEKLDPLLDRVADAAGMILAGNVSEAMTEFNKKGP